MDVNTVARESTSEVLPGPKQSSSVVHGHWANQCKAIYLPIGMQKVL